MQIYAVFTPPKPMAAPTPQFGATTPAVELMTLCQSTDVARVHRGARRITTIDNLDDQAALVRAAKTSLADYQRRAWLRDAANMADVADPSRFDTTVVPTLKVLGNVLGMMAQTNRPLAETLYGELSTDPYLARFYPKPQPMADPVVSTTTRDVSRSAQAGNHPMQRVFGAWHLLAQVLTGEWWRRPSA